MRYATARKEHTCKDCKEVIKKDEICVQGGRRFYHKKCHAKMTWLPSPKMTETVRRKEILDWYLKKHSNNKTN